MEWLDIEIKLFISNKGPFNLYVINHCLKSRLLTPLTSSTTLTLAVPNNPPPTAELPLPINVTAPSINVTAPSINVTAPSINVTAPSIKVTAAINYGRDLATLAKKYIKESKYSKEDDNFDYKLIIFNNLCNRVEIP